MEQDVTERIILAGEETGEHLRLEYRPEQRCWTLVSFYKRTGGNDGHKYDARDLAHIPVAAIKLAAERSR